MRLVNADEVYKVLTDYYHHRTETQHEALKEALSKVPTVDAVEVVRCKDCVYFWGGVCTAHTDVISTDDNEFCSWGERREDE